MKNFGEFYNNQIETASTVILSRTDSIPQQKLGAAVAMIRELNPAATIVTTPWNELTGAQIGEALEGKATLAAELARLEQEHAHHHEGHHCCCGGHHHHDDEHHCCGHHDHDEHHHHHEDGHCCHGEHGHHEDEHHCCGHHDHDEHHHHHEDGHCCHGDHHHHHDEEHHCCGGHHHEHHHEHEHEHCGCHGHHDHHDHHADEVFTSWGAETARKYTQDEVETALCKLDSREYGFVLRAKGIVACTDGGWLHFDYVPGECNVRSGSAAITGKLCVIGAELDEFGVAQLFGV